VSKPYDDFLHVYGQYMWHDDAVIRGTKTALLALREAIDSAIATGTGETEVFATDGEGYLVVIQCVNTVAAIGQPEYRIHDEYVAAQRAAERWNQLSRPAAGWDQDSPSAPAEKDKEGRRE